MLISFLRAVFLYLVLIMCIRLMGKRQIGEMEPAEFVVTMLIANIAAVPMQDNAIPLTTGLVPILTILGVELLISVFTLSSIRMRTIFCGRPVILVENGKILEDNLRQTRVNLDELTEHLRHQGIYDLQTVKYAILETDGEISTMLYAKYTPPSARDLNVRVKDDEMPYTIISYGKILHENLKLCGLSLAWLEQQLRQRGCRAKDVLLMTVDCKGKIYFAKKGGST